MPEGLAKKSERQENIEKFARQVIETFKGRVSGKSFSLSRIGGEYIDSNMTIIPDRSNPGQALWDPSSPNNVLYGQREDTDHSGIITLNNILVTPEAKGLISKIMQELKIPPEMQEETRKQIAKDYPPLN